MFRTAILFLFLAAFVLNSAHAMLMPPLMFDIHNTFLVEDSAARDAINHFSRQGYRFYIHRCDDRFNPYTFPEENYGMIGYAKNSKISESSKRIINDAIKLAISEKKVRFSFLDYDPIYEAYIITDTKYNASAKYLAAYNLTMLNLLITEYSLDISLMCISNYLPEGLPFEIDPKKVRIVTYRAIDAEKGGVTLPVFDKDILRASDFMSAIYRNGGRTPYIPGVSDNSCLTQEEKAQVRSHLSSRKIEPKVLGELGRFSYYEDIFLFNDNKGTIYFVDEPFLAVHNIELINKILLDDGIDVVIRKPRMGQEH